MNAKQVIKLMEAAGWTEARQRGSHRIFKKEGVPYSITVPDHGKTDLAPGTLHSILKDAGLK